MSAAMWCVALVALVVLGAGPASAQRLQVNPYGALGFSVPADPDLCKTGTSGVDADARDTVRDISQGTELELNNCHLHPVEDSFSVSPGTSSPCHPDHEPPGGNCGRPLVEWCDNPCTTNACGQTNCLRAECPVIETTHEVLAPSWTYTFPLDAANSHELVIDATRQRKDLRGNCQCNTYSTAACPADVNDGCVTVAVWNTLPDNEQANTSICSSLTSDDTLPGLQNENGSWTSEQPTDDD